VSGNGSRGSRGSTKVAPVPARAALPTERAGWDVLLLGGAWMILFFVNNHRLYFGVGKEHRSNLLNALIELFAYGVAFFLVLLDFYRGRRDGTEGSARTPLHLGLFVFPIWCTASLVWGTLSVQLFIRGAEFVFTAYLANSTIRRARLNPGFMDALLGFLFRWFTAAVIGLTFLGFAIGPKWARLDPNDTRFSWIAAHPGVSGGYLAAALTILVLAPKSVVRLPLAIRVMVIGVMGVALVKNHSRTAELSFLFAVLAGVWLLGRYKPALRIFVPPYALGGAVIFLLYEYKDVVKYALRGGSSQDLLTLNNRTHVWALLPEKLTWAGRWVIGLGYGASHTAFVQEFSFAGNAHNTIVALLVGVGAVGLVIMAAYLVMGFVGVAKTLLRTQPDVGVLMLLVLATLVIQSTTADAFSDPNFGLAWLYLCLAIGIAERPRVGAVRPRDAATMVNRLA
jgi:hypothetical protein